jgi:hypothetical protein
MVKNQEIKLIQTFTWLQNFNGREQKNNEVLKIHSVTFFNNLPMSHENNVNTIPEVIILVLILSLFWILLVVPIFNLNSILYALCM